MPEQPTRATNAGGPPGRPGAAVPLRSAIFVAIVPLICALLVAGVTVIRLIENERQLEAGLARVASTWLADRLALAGADQRDALLEHAAERLGFSFEGVFRQDMVVKGRNRDTAWFSMLDHEWPRIKAGFEAWLSPTNFGQDGAQRASLAALRDR